jgi:hypothetical protein
MAALFLMSETGVVVEKGTGPLLNQKSKIFFGSEIIGRQIDNSRADRNDWEIIRHVA